MNSALKWTLHYTTSDCDADKELLSLKVSASYKEFNPIYANNPNITSNFKALANNQVFKPLTLGICNVTQAKNAALKTK